MARKTLWIGQLKTLIQRAKKLNMLDRALNLRLGALLWVSSVQYYIVQLLAAWRWPNGNDYSWANNTISDLANTHCGAYGQRLVCSPLHPLMNTSFVVLGITMITGAYIFGRNAPRRIASLGYAGIAAGGVGTILVGLFPENTVSALHVLGAALPFIFGNLGMLVLGVYDKQLPKPLRAYTVLSGLVGIVALIIFMQQWYGPLGIGGLERIVAYPQSIWMIVYGAYMLVRQQRRKSITAI